MKNEQEEYIDERTITPQSGVRLSVGLIAALVVDFAYFLYARDEYFDSRNQVIFSAHEEHVTKELESIRSSLKEKANATQAKDRFTGKDFETYQSNQLAQDEQFKESVEQRFKLVEEKNDAQHEAIKERINHGRDDLRDAIQRIDNHYNMKGSK